MKDQVLSIEQMKHLVGLGVDTSKASAVLLFFDENGNVLGWDVEDNGKSEKLYEHYNKELEIWESTNISIFDADTFHYDHSYRKTCGTFTLQDILEMLPLEIKHYYLVIYKNKEVLYECEVFGLYDYLSSFDEEDTLIKNAYNALVWAIKNKHLKEK